jgi:hypothetical protein
VDRDERSEVILVVRPVPQNPPEGLLGFFAAIGSTVGTAMESAANSAMDVVATVAGPPTSAVLDRVVPGVTDAVVQRIDITGLVLARVDLRAIVMQTLDRIDLTQLVLDRVDLRRIVEAALDSIDVTEIVLQRVDLVAVVDAVLDQMNLTELVEDRVDIDALVATVDLEPVIDRLPIVEIAEYVIEQTDLPAIIRQSTGGIAADVVDAVRLRSYATDVATARIIDRLLPRRGRKLDAPGEPESLSGGES